MNKKIIGIILSILFIVTCVGGCNTVDNNDKNLSENESSVNIEEQNNDIEENNKKEGKILVAYFSRAGENYGVGTVKVGNTAMMASYIEEYLNADSFEIVPVNPYPDSYEETKTISQKETADNARPKIKNEVDNFDSYDTIFIGYPIWYGDYPMIINTFLESYNFNGKTVIPFNTHGGSGDAGTYSKIESKLLDANVNTNGLAINGSAARTDEGKKQTLNWLKELGY